MGSLLLRFGSHAVIVSKRRRYDPVAVMRAISRARVSALIVTQLIYNPLAGTYKEQYLRSVLTKELRSSIVRIFTGKI